MADENNIQQTPVADKIIADAVQSPDAPAPSTPEAQQETANIQAFQEEVSKEQTRLGRVTGKKPSFGEAQVSVIERLAKQKEQADIKQTEVANKQAQEENKNLIQAQKDADRYSSAKQKAAELGIPFQDDEDAENFIQQQSVSQDKLDIDTAMQDALSKKAAAAQVQQEEEEVESAKLNAEQELQKEILRPEIAKQQVMQEAQRESIQKNQSIIDNEINEIQKEREAISDQDFKSFWASKTTGDKIIAGIALALGGIGAGLTGGENQALKVINNSINQDFEKQKLTKDQKLRAVNGKLEAVKLKIQEASRRSDDKLKQMKANALQKEIENQQIANQQERIKAAMFAQGGDVPESMLSKEDRERVVRMPDDSIRLADSKAAATATRKFISETQPSIIDLQELVDIANSDDFNKLDPRDRTLVAAKRQGLIGQLRISLVGPGVMNAQELALINNTLGDPRKLLFPETEKRKLTNLMSSLNKRINVRYQQAGIKPPVMQGGKMLQGTTVDKVNKANLKRIMQNNKNLTKKSAESELKKRNLWAN